MVDEHDKIKLIDFGLASDATSRRLTYTNLANELGNRRLHFSGAGSREAR